MLILDFARKCTGGLRGRFWRLAKVWLSKERIFVNIQGEILTPQGGLEFQLKYHLNWGRGQFREWGDGSLLREK